MACAQEQARPGGGVLAEVVVTAQFRQENLQDTPIAITAVTGDMLEARSQTSVSDVAAQAPNVTLSPQGQANGSGLVAFIRGVGQTDFNFALEPGVGLYIDDVYYSTLTGSLVDLMDLERVEILRGPQGTLAGRNSIGGAIKLFSRKPEGDGGMVSLTYGKFSRIDARAMGDFEVLPNTLFARIAAVTKNRDGYVDRVDYGCTHPGSGVPTFSVGNGCKLGTLGGIAYTAGRVSLRWLASSDLEINIIGDITNDSSEAGADVLRRAELNGASSFPIFIDDGDPSTPPVPYDCRFVPYGPHSCDPNQPNDPYLSYATFLDPGLNPIPGLPAAPFKPVVVPPIQHLDQYGISASIDWALSDNYALKSITAWRRYDSSWAQDVDGSPLASQMLLQTLEHWQWSQELRLNGAVLDGAVDFTLGAFYFKQDGTLEARVDLPYAGIDFVHGPDTTPSTSKAVFAHAAWHATDRLNISAGVRYSEDEKTYTYFRRNPDGTLPQCIPMDPFNPFDPAQPPNCALSGLFDVADSFEGDRVDWRLALDYRWSSDFMSYAQVSTGYKGGGVNPRPFFGPSTPEINQLKAFDPETLTTYEVGFKTDLFNRTMRVNMAFFYNDYQDIILTSSACPISPCLQPNNIGEAEVKGIELETEIHPADGWTIDAAVSYLDFQYKETDTAQTGVTLDMITPYTPEFKASAGIQYRHDVGAAGTVTLRLDGSYQSKMFGEAINAPTNRIDGYHLANARLSWRTADERWDTSLEVLNLTDELYYTFVYDQAFSSGTTSYSPALPRTWAITVKRTF
ncbi:MAG: TonB-dependent receptor [Proteobacteria bacterium]|nr:MAG: TonB-dependent receptor [Pseudomonadota bacterium]